MKNKKAIIIIICAILAIAGVATAAIVLTKNTGDEEEIVATVVSTSEKRELLENDIISWDSSTKEHEGVDDTKQCCVTVGDITTYYDTFEEGWIAANTTDKNKDETTFTLFADWVADGNGGFGTGYGFVSQKGGLEITGWTTKLTINFNGYKIDRNIIDNTGNCFSSVIKVNKSKDVHFENGYITGGATTYEGAGVSIYDSTVYFENMTISGNVSGDRGGGIFVDSYSCIYLDDTIVEGNYAYFHGGGVYCDYNENANTDIYKIKEVSGTVRIINNLGSEGSNNLVLNSKFRYSVGACIEKAELSDDSAIHVLGSQYDGIVKPVVLDAGNNSKYFQYFQVDSSEYKFRFKDMNIESDNYLGMLCLY